MTMNILNLIGLAGVEKTENERAVQFEKYFQYCISFIAVWLPIQWYLRTQGLMDPLLVYISDWTIWAILFFEAVTLTYLVDHKKQFLFSNWLTLVVVIICFPPLWWYPSLIAVARFLRFIVFLRLLIPSSRTLIAILATNRLGTTLLVAFIVTTITGLLITFFDPAIRTPWDGVWWAWETVTTVGYGDEAPSTVAGRLIAIALMIFGAGLLSLLTANLSAYFINKGKISNQVSGIKKEEDEVIKRLQNIEIQLTELKKQLGAANDSNPNSRVKR